MKLRRILAVGLLVGSLSACTKAQEHAWLKATGQKCEEDMPCWDCHVDGNHVCGNPRDCRDDELFNKRDHRCESPTEFCKRTFGADAHPVEDKNGDIGCYRIK